MSIKKKISTLAFILCCSLTMSLLVACDEKDTKATKSEPSSSQTVSSEEKDAQKEVSSQASSKEELKPVSSETPVSTTAPTPNQSTTSNKTSSALTPKKPTSSKITTSTKTTPSSKIVSSQSPVSNTPAPSPAPSGTRPYLSIEDEILLRVNNLRASLGLNPLAKNTKLVTAATIRSDEMLATGQFDHTRPNGTSFSTAIDQAGYIWSRVGENIAYCSGYSSSQFADVFFEGWKNSPGHYANMVKPEFTEIGIAISFNGTTAYATQNFGTPR